MDTIEQLAPPTLSYVFTKVLEDDTDGATQYARFRSLAQRRGSRFLAVLVECELTEELNRVNAPDRVERRKWTDPVAVEQYRQQMRLFEPPPSELLRIDTTTIGPLDNAQIVRSHLQTTT